MPHPSTNKCLLRRLHSSISNLSNMFNIHSYKLQYTVYLICLTCLTYVHVNYNIQHIYVSNICSTCLTYCLFFIHNFAKQFRHVDWQGYGSFIHQWTKRYSIVNKAICGTKESATPNDELETWKETVLLLTIVSYSPRISTMVMKQLCSTSLSLTELTALMVTGLLILQNIKTD